MAREIPVSQGARRSVAEWARPPLPRALLSAWLVADCHWRGEMGSAYAAPGWMSGATAAQVDPGFEVLVPAHLSAPLAGEPQVDVGDGSYGPRWMVQDRGPRLLHIAGDLEGEITGYAEDDRNNQLQIDA